MAVASSTVAALAQLDDRDIRALTEVMTVCKREPDLRDEQVAVYSSHQADGGMVTERYVVSPDVPACDCRDMLHRRPASGCKHVRRVAFERGERAIPAGIDHSALAPGLHIDNGGSQ